MLEPLSSISSHLYQFCYYWKTKLKMVFEEEIKIEQVAKQQSNEMQNKQVASL